jgi:hypothetical protein
VYSIGEMAFRNNQLTSIIIPDSVSSIGERAFENNQLMDVTIGKNVASIARDAFAGNQLTSITIPDSVTFIDGGAFRGNQLTNVIIGANVTLGHYITWVADIDFWITIDAIDNYFNEFYNTGGKKAGTYIFSDGQWNMK